MPEPQTMSLHLPGMKKPVKVPKWAPIAGAGVVGVGAFLLLRGKGSTSSAPAESVPSGAGVSPVTPVEPTPIPVTIPVPNPVVPTFPSPTPVIDTSGSSGTSSDSVNATSPAEAPSLQTLDSQIQGAGFAVMREQYALAGLGASGKKFDGHLAETGGAGNLEVPAGPQSSRFDLGDTAHTPSPSVRDTYIVPAAGKGPGAKRVPAPETVAEKIQGAGWAAMREERAGITSRIVTPAAGKGPGAVRGPTAAITFLKSQGIKTSTTVPKPKVTTKQLTGDIRLLK